MQFTNTGTQQKPVILTKRTYAYTTKMEFLFDRSIIAQVTEPSSSCEVPVAPCSVYPGACSPKSSAGVRDGKSLPGLTGRKGLRARFGKGMY